MSNYKIYEYEIIYGDEKRIVRLVSHKDHFVNVKIKLNEIMNQTWNGKNANSYKINTELPIDSLILTIPNVIEL